MKKTFGLLALLSLAAFGSTPIEKMVPVDHIFSPSGFDSNDNVEIIVKGYLPNLCHKSPYATVEVKGNKVDIKVTSLYYEDNSPFCPEMVVPFTESVKLGILDKGKYEVTVNGKSQWEKKDNIQVDTAVSNSVDEFSYAYVNHIQKEGTSKGYVKLEGYNPSDCFQLEKIDVISNGKDTYSILPRMKQVSDFCPMKMVPFSYEMKVPNDIERNEVLLHVRTLDGKSVNSLYYK